MNAKRTKLLFDLLLGIGLLLLMSYQVVGEAGCAVKLMKTAISTSW